MHLAETNKVMAFSIFCFLLTNRFVDWPSKVTCGLFVLCEEVDVREFLKVYGVDKEKPLEISSSGGQFRCRDETRKLAVGLRWKKAGWMCVLFLFSLSIFLMHKRMLFFATCTTCQPGSSRGSSRRGCECPNTRARSPQAPVVARSLNVHVEYSVLQVLHMRNQSYGRFSPFVFLPRHPETRKLHSIILLFPDSLFSKK